MPWFVVSYDFLEGADISRNDLNGVALRYGWDRYKDQDGTFSALPSNTLAGEFTDYAAAEVNVLQVFREVDAGEHNASTNIFLMEIRQSRIITHSR